MRYLDKLLEGANNFKKIRFAVDKAKEAGHRADKQQGKYLDRLTSKGKFSTDDKKQSDTLDRMRDAEEVEDRAIKMANKLVPRVHKKGGGKGDGKPRGKLRLVQSAFYQQVGHLIAEIRMRGFDQGTYDARHGAIKDMKTSDNAEALTGEAIKLIKKLKLKPDHPVVKNAMSTAELADLARERAMKRVVRGSTPTPTEQGYKKRTKKGLPDDSSKN
jgi:hypothetical protein